MGRHRESYYSCPIIEWWTNYLEHLRNHGSICEDEIHNVFSLVQYIEYICNKDLHKIESWSRTLWFGT